MTRGNPPLPRASAWIAAAALYWAPSEAWATVVQFTGAPPPDYVCIGTKSDMNRGKLSIAIDGKSIDCASKSGNETHNALCTLRTRDATTVNPKTAFPPNALKDWKSIACWKNSSVSSNKPPRFALILAADTDNTETVRTISEIDLDYRTLTIRGSGFDHGANLGLEITGGYYEKTSATNEGNSKSPAELHLVPAVRPHRIMLPPGTIASLLGAPRGPGITFDADTSTVAIDYNQFIGKKVEFKNGDVHYSSAQWTGKDAPEVIQLHSHAVTFVLYVDDVTTQCPRASVATPVGECIPGPNLDGRCGYRCPHNDWIQLPATINFTLHDPSVEGGSSAANKPRESPAAAADKPAAKDQPTTTGKPTAGENPATAEKNACKDWLAARRATAATGARATKNRRGTSGAPTWSVPLTQMHEVFDLSIAPERVKVYLTRPSTECTEKPKPGKQRQDNRDVNRELDRPPEFAVILRLPDGTTARHQLGPQMPGSRGVWVPAPGRSHGETLAYTYSDETRQYRSERLQIKVGYRAELEHSHHLIKRLGVVVGAGGGYDGSSLEGTGKPGQNNAHGRLDLSFVYWPDARYGRSKTCSKCRHLVAFDFGLQWLLGPRRYYSVAVLDGPTTTSRRVFYDRLIFAPALVFFFNKWSALDVSPQLGIGFAHRANEQRLVGSNLVNPVLGGAIGARSFGAPYGFLSANLRFLGESRTRFVSDGVARPALDPGWAFTFMLDVAVRFDLMQIPFLSSALGRQVRRSESSY